MMPPMVKQPTGEPGVVAPASTHVPAKPAPQGQDESTIAYKQQGKTADRGFIAHVSASETVLSKADLSENETLLSMMALSRCETIAPVWRPASQP